MAQEGEQGVATHLGGGEAEVVELPQENKTAGGDHEEGLMAGFNRDLLDKIVVRLPTKTAYRCCLLSRPWRFFTTERVFFEHHLEPRPLQHGEHPAAIIVQPQNGGRLGYVHLLLLGLDGGNPLDAFPLHPSLHRMAPVRAPPTTPTAVEAAAAPPVSDLLTFFKETAPRMDMSIISSNGRLLARCPNSSYYVCLPEMNRFVKLPPSPVETNAETAAAIHYEIGTDGLNFRVVLFAHDPRYQLMAYDFTSSTATWASHHLELKMHDAALDPKGVGTDAGAFFWLGGQRHGRIVCYNQGRASVLEVPPALKDGTRLGRSLGSVKGKLRLSAFDMLDPHPGNVQPHEVTGVYRTWSLNKSSGAWEAGYEKECEDVYMSFYSIPHGPELPLDFAGAGTSTCFAVKNGALIQRNVQTGRQRALCNFQVHLGGRMGTLYQDCDIFPLFE